MNVSPRIIVFAVIAVLFVGGAAQAESWREKVCKASGNVFLRVSAAYDPASQTVVNGCLCNVPQEQYSQYLSWCLNQATDDDLGQINSSMATSHCTTRNEMQHCIQPSAAN
jgi:hypothetical protein